MLHFWPQTTAITPNINRAGDHEHFFHGDMFVVFGIFLTLVCILHWPFFTMPPVWDTAAGVFAPAIYLYENNGDYLQLIQQTGYVDGGPNVHSFSAITLLTYAAIYITDGDTAVYLPLLHAIHFAFAAIALTATFGLARCLLGTAQAWVLSLCLLVFPIFLVQTGYLYTEVLGSALVLLSLLSWSSRHYVRMALFSIAACLIKSFGVALVSTIVLLLIIDSTLRLSKRITIAASILLVTSAIELAKWSSAAATDSSDKVIYLDHLKSIIGHLNKVPDLHFLVSLSLIFCFGFLLYKKLWHPRLLFSRITELLEGNKQGRAWLAIALIPVALFGFIAIAPLLTEHRFFLLPRYYVWSLPEMLIIFSVTVTAFGSWLKHHKPFGYNISVQVFSFAAFMVLLAYLTINRTGMMYPDSGQGTRAFSVAERSMEYLSFFNVQLAGAKSVAEYASGRPVFVARGSHYFLSSPLMGYVNQPIENTQFVLNKPYPSRNLQDFPDEFLLLDANSNNFHGQYIITDMARQIKWRNDYEIETLASHSSGPYHSKLFRIYQVKND